MVDTAQNGPLSLKHLHDDMGIIIVFFQNSPGPDKITVTVVPAAYFIHWKVEGLDRQTFFHD
jgi:hypothetical protein